MEAKQCRSVFNGMIAKLAELYPDPTKIPPDAAEAMSRTIAMFQLQALWEIAAQISEFNENNKNRIHTLQ